ncbi:zf-DHHC-domain-containing protein [Xylaria palmicola]|nr:zf-DHHC-domain-containing protein [Xylaria palmicola]
MAFLVGSSAPGLQRLAVPFASLLIAALGYGSQWLFATSPDLEPGPLTPKQSRIFNALLLCLWWTYWRACTVDPGRYEFPRPSSKREGGRAATTKSRRDGGTAAPQSSEEEDDDDEGDDQAGSHGGGRSAAADDHTRTAAARRRWCRKCAAPKPPRAHHCKTCGRCVPKMDHHCPWTGNCVGLQTFPHFARFLVYTNASLWLLAYFLGERLRALWAARHLPAYLGPTAGQLAALAALTLATGLTALVLGILLATTARGWLLNTTMIEGWEIERHEAVVRRGGYAEEDWWRAPDGDAGDADDVVPGGGGSSGGGGGIIDPVEFPYDVGFFTNLAQAMGTANPLYWLLPFAGGPRVARLPPTTTLEDVTAALGGVARARAAAAALGTGWHYEENGLNDREGLWPPVDPDKARNAALWRRRRREERRYRREREAGLRDPALPRADLSPEEEKAAFQRRQEHDLRRWRDRRAQMLDELEEAPYPPAGRRTAPPPGWVNADGEHLGDYGVDEDAEFFDDDDYVDDGAGEEGVEEDRGAHAIDPDDDDDEEVPLAELIRRRKVRTKDGEDT